MPPLVSIGVPVFNEATHLADALGHLLAQDYPNLEVTVCDNASTDATATTAREWASRDPRVKVIAQPTNIGAAANFEAAFQHARGEYFMWAAGHDRWSTNYVSACVAALEANPDAVLASGQSRWFGDDVTADTGPSALYSTAGLAPCARFLTVLHGNMHPVYGLIRRDVLVAIGGVPRMVGADLVLLTRLAWKGEFLVVPECWWYRRRMHGEERYAQKMKRYRSARYQLAGSSLLARISPLAPLVMELSKQCVSRPRGLLQRVALTGALPCLMILRWLERD
jgi:glycosyltransferase involved in cell wall biosynthesis